MRQISEGNRLMSVFAVLTWVHSDHRQCRETNQDIDNPFHHWPCSEEHVHEIELLAHETTNTYQTPIERPHQN